MIIIGKYGAIEFPATNMFVRGNAPAVIVPIRARYTATMKMLQALGDMQPFAMYDSAERAQAVIVEAVREWANGTKVFEMPAE